MFKSHLGLHAQIVSLEINPGCEIFEEDQIAVRIGQSARFGISRQSFKEFGMPDIVLDDAITTVANRSND